MYFLDETFLQTCRKRNKGTTCYFDKSCLQTLRLFDTQLLAQTMFNSDSTRMSCKNFSPLNKFSFWFACVFIWKTLKNFFQWVRVEIYPIAKVISSSTDAHLNTSVLVLSLTNTRENLVITHWTISVLTGTNTGKSLSSLLWKSESLFTVSVNDNVVVDCAFISTKLSANKNQCMELHWTHFLTQRKNVDIYTSVNKVSAKKISFLPLRHHQLPYPLHWHSASGKKEG